MFTNYNLSVRKITHFMPQLELTKMSNYIKSIIYKQLQGSPPIH